MNTPNPHTQGWPDRLTELLDHQHSLTSRLSSLADAQTALIASRQTDALLGLLGQRQQIVDELMASSDELTVLVMGLDDPKVAATAPPGVRDRIRSQVAVISQALEAVSRRDEQDQKALQAGCAEVKSELGSLDAARTARNAYVNAAAPGGAVNRFADRKG